MRTASHMLLNAGIVPVVRGRSSRYVAMTVSELVDAGCTVVELTLTTPGALDSLGGLRRQFGDDVLIGMGSVQTVPDLERAISAGAQFLVSPIALDEALSPSGGGDVPIVRAGLTPTELHAADALGSPLVKLFPASLGGPRYLREVLAPLPMLSVMPSGGVSVESIPDWRRAGAVAVSLGGNLLGDALGSGDLHGLAQRVHHARQLWEEAASE